MASKKEQAQGKLLEAQKFESEGDMTQAVECYRRAFKLWPELEDDFKPDTNEDDGDTFTRMPNSRGEGGPKFRSFPASQMDCPEQALAMKLFFEEEGYLVIDGVMSTEEVKIAEGHFRNFMSCVGIDVTEKESLDSRFADPAIGLVGKTGAGHSAMNWFVRSRPKVRQGFALTLLDEEGYMSTLSQPSSPASSSGVGVTSRATAGGAGVDVTEPRRHETRTNEEGGDAGSKGDDEGAGCEKDGKASTTSTTKLITSFDGFNYFRNPETDPSWQSGTTSWLHYDCGHKSHQRYIQGIVNLIDCTDENDAGLVIFPRSHRTCFPFTCPQEPEDPSFITYMGNVEWQRVKERNVRERAFRVPLKAGSLVMWRSSVMHCNSGCLPRSAEKKNEDQLIRRLAVYVCMCRDPQDPKLTAQRLKYFNEGRTCGHWPDVLRESGDRAQLMAFLQQGAIITSVDKLPPGASCLL